MSFPIVLPVEYAHAEIPQLNHAKPGDAGIDLVMDWWSYDEQAITNPNLRQTSDLDLTFHDSVVIGTGVRIVLSDGYFGQLSVRSGLGIKHGIVAHLGIIDAGYRGELFSRLTKLAGGRYRIQRFDRVIQLVVQPFVTLTPVRITDAAATHVSARGADGLGSSGN